MNEKELIKIIKLLFDVKMINYDLEKVIFLRDFNFQQIEVFVWDIGSFKVV